VIVLHPGAGRSSISEGKADSLRFRLHIETAQTALVLGLFDCSDRAIDGGDADGGGAPEIAWRAFRAFLLGKRQCHCFSAC